MELSNFLIKQSYQLDDLDKIRERETEVRDEWIGWRTFLVMWISESKFKLRLFRNRSQPFFNSRVSLFDLSMCP